MKLYTEEQLKKAFEAGNDYASKLHPASMGEYEKHITNVINALTPIQLPTDEEMYEKFAPFMENTTLYALGYSDGVDWIIEHIEQQL